jgi:hypothetical protein
VLGDARLELRRFLVKLGDSPCQQSQREPGRVLAAQLPTGSDQLPAGHPREPFSQLGGSSDEGRAQLVECRRSRPHRAVASRHQDA